MIDEAIIAVVVPARDEEPWVGQVLATMPRFVDQVVVVDDGSRDDTAAVVRAAAPPATVALISHPRPLGVGAAIIAGYRAALARGADVIAVMAGDGQMHPNDLRRLVHRVVAGEADYVKGDRLHHPDAWRLMPKKRLLGSLLLSWLTTKAAGVAISDSQCGYTAVSARALKQLDLDRIWPGYGYPNHLIGSGFALTLADETFD